MSDALLALKAAFKALDERHTAIRARIEPLRAKREKFNLEAIAAQEKANAISDEMQKIYEETGFVDLARERGSVAEALMALKKRT